MQAAAAAPRGALRSRDAEIAELKRARRHTRVPRTWAMQITVGTQAPELVVPRGSGGGDGGGCGGGGSTNVGEQLLAGKRGKRYHLTN